MISDIQCSDLIKGHMLCSHTSSYFVLFGGSQNSYFKHIVNFINNNTYITIYVHAYTGIDHASAVAP
jgi:hypothetical protein